MLPQEAIIEFQRLYKEKYGIEISIEEAALRAQDFIKIYRAVCLDTKGSGAADPNKP